MFAAYSTQKQVKLLDRKLGILYFVCILLVLGYVVGMRVILERSYNSIEKSYGIIGARLNGTTHMQLGGSSVPHDVASLTHVQEGDAIFLPTRIVTTHEQRLGNCTSPDEPCSVDSDCPVDPPLAAGLCTQGHCQVHQWCNAGGATSQRADPFTGVSGSATEEVIDAASFASLRLVVISTIQFPTLGRSVLSTEDAERGAKRSWSLSQLLLRARLDATDAIANGAVLAVTLHWNCHNLFDEDACEPTLLATPLSRSQPYATSWAHYYRRGAAGGPQYRDLLQVGLPLRTRTSYMPPTCTPTESPAHPLTTPWIPPPAPPPPSSLSHALGARPLLV